MAGATFAFVHGGGQGSWVWNETIAALAAQDPSARTIAFDMAGCGAKRGQDTSGLSTREVAEAFTAELAASGHHDIILVGHSAAGTVLPVTAELRPDLLRRIVYVTCSAPPPGTSVMELFGTGEQGTRDDEIGWPGGLAGDPLARLRRMFCNDMAGRQAGAFVAKLGQDHWPTLAAVQGDRAWRYDHLGVVRSTYVICLQDQALPERWQRLFADRFQVERRVVVDAGHQVMNTRPHALAELLRHEAD